MIKSITGKLISAIFLLWIISLISFWLSKQIPGDEVMDYISIDDRSYHANSDPLQHRLSYERVAVSRSLNLPEFYFTISPRYYSDTINRILPSDDKAVVKHWAFIAGDAKTAYSLYSYLRAGLNEYCDVRQTSYKLLLCNFFNRSLSTREPAGIRDNAIDLAKKINSDTIYQQSIISLEHIITLATELNGTTPESEFSNLWPSVYWNSDNQYKQWLKGLLFQKPLTSLIDGRNAWSKIYEAVKWTLLLNGFALLIAIIAGVKIGVWSGVNDGKKTEKIVNWILFALFALPSFWLGTLLIYFFASGEWLLLFPTGGLGSFKQSGNGLERASIVFIHLFLPVVCLALGSLAYVSRQMKQSFKHELNQPYVFMLNAQGVSQKTIINKHVFRNALFPIITIVGGSIPVLLSGSLIIEVIFSIPGMGRLMHNSLMARDWPVVFPVLILGSLITILSYHLSDFVYKWLDPRVKTFDSE